jgi:hypothetical protein
MMKTTGMGRTAWMLATALVLAAGSTASADKIVYDTSGLVGSTGITGTAAITFVPVTQNFFNAPSTLSLGTFVVAALPNGQTTTYNHTPFAVSFAIKTVDGLNVAAVPQLLTVTGFLNGTLTGSNLSTIIAVFNPIPNSHIVLGPNLAAVLSLPSPQRTLVPSTTLGGQSTAEAFVDLFVTTPEPSSIAMFLAVGAGLGYYRLRRKSAR